jgi:hypothetical protein
MAGCHRSHRSHDRTDPRLAAHDERTAALVDVVAAVGADEHTTAVVQRGEGALHDRAVATKPEPCSVWRRAISGLMPRVQTSRRYLSWS